jgi:hypothetical protein
MKHNLCGRRAILEGDVKPLEREKLDPNGLKFPLLHRYIIDVSKLVMPARCGGESPHISDGAIAYELWCYRVTVYQSMFRARRDIDCVEGLRWRREK